jgi:hypothetical protein
MAFSTPRAVSGPTELALPSADRFFVGLDQRSIGPSGWTALVLGVHADERGLWIQVGRADNPEVSLVLRAPYDVPIERLVSALEAWQPTNANLCVRDLT